MNELLTAVERLAWIDAIRRDVWAYGALNALHIFSFGLLLGSIVNVDLRLIGIWRGDRWREGMAEALPMAQVGFALAVGTGAMLFAVRAARYAGMPPFQLKMALVVLALVNILAFHRVFYRQPERTAAMRLSACASLTLWIAILASGRAIGFF